MVRRASGRRLQPKGSPVLFDSLGACISDPADKAAAWEAFFLAEVGNNGALRDKCLGPPDDVFLPRAAQVFDRTVEDAEDYRCDLTRRVRKLKLGKAPASCHRQAGAEPRERA